MKNYNARNKRQLKTLVEKLSQINETANTNEADGSMRSKLIAKIKRLIDKIEGFWIRNFMLKSTLSVAVLLTSLAINAQTFSAPQDFNSYAGFEPKDIGTPAIYKPSLADIDGDGDLDLFFGGNIVGLTFIENIGTPSVAAFDSNQVSSPFNFVDPISHSGFSPRFIDLDDDGDLDLLGGVYYYGDLYYYENIGDSVNPNFGAKQTNPFNIVPGSHGFGIDVIDLDDDGDLDIITSDYYGDFRYYENVGNSAAPNYSVPLSSPFGLTTAPGWEATPTFMDVDNDGDLDLFVGTSTATNDIQYYENIGSKCQPLFTSPVQNPFGLLESTSGSTREAATFGDMDRDGDLDLFVGTSNHSIYYYEFHGVAPVITPDSDSLLTVNTCTDYFFNDSLYAESGIYEDTTTASNGCQQNIFLTLEVTNIDTTVSNNGSELIALDTTADSYQWIDCDNANAPISGEDAASFTPSSTGNYAVIITKNSCESTTDCEEITISGIKTDHSFSSGAILYPNPTNGSVFVQFKDIKMSETSVEVFDLTGTKVSSTIVNSNNKIEIGLPSQKGIYLVKIGSSSNFETFKVTKK